MSKVSFIETFLAAHDLSTAITNGRTPDVRSLKTLGITDEMAKRFKR